MSKTVGTYSVQVGQRMRQVRLERGMTLGDVETASQGRFPAVVLGAWERGTRSIYTDNLAAYARWLGVPVAFLLPPDPDREARMAGLTAEVAGRAVSGMTDLFSSVSPAEARKLLTAALEDEGGEAA